MQSGFQKTIAIILVVFLGIVLAYGLWPYVNSFIGAMILYVLFKRLHLWFCKHMKKGISALLIILISILIVIIPIFSLAALSINQVSDAFEDIENIQIFIQEIDDRFGFINITERTDEIISRTATFVKDLLLAAINSATGIALQIVIMYFVLYYLLVNVDKMHSLIASITPFNQKNSDKLARELSNITYSTVVSSGIIAVVQGGLIAIAFFLFGIDGALFWGLVSAFLSFLPVVGPPVIWVPAVIIQFIQGNIGAGIGVLIFGIILSNVDNFLRPYINKQVANIHPLTSLIGVFIGIPIFGLLGIFVGPLLISYFLLTIQMFKEEYT